MKENLHIAFIVKSFPAITETFIVNQINQIIEHGNDVTIFSYNRPQVEGKHQSIDKYNLNKLHLVEIQPNKNYLLRALQFLKIIITSKHLNFKILIRSLNFFKFRLEAINLSLFFQAQFFILNPKFDVIHVNFGNVGIKINKLLAKGIIRPNKFIITFHGYDLSKKNVIENYSSYVEMLTFCDIITVNSSYLRKQLIKKFKLPELESKIKIIPMGTDSNKFHRIGDSSSTRKAGESLNVVFIGRLIYLKGPQRIIEIANSIRSKRPDAKINFHIIGDGELYNEIVKEIIELDLRNSITLYSSINHERIVSILNNMHVLIMPGLIDSDEERAEAQGVVIQEAQSMEIPVIVSDVGGMAEGLIDGKTGFVVPHKSIDEFCKRIIQLYDYEDSRLILAKNARNFVLDNYSLAKMGDDFNSIYYQ